MVSVYPYICIRLHCLKSLSLDNKRVFLATYGGGVYYSDNYGEQWQQTNLKDKTVLSIDIHPFDRMFLVCGTKKDGVMISFDGGINWSQSSFSDAQVYGVKILKVR